MDPLHWPIVTRDKLVRAFQPGADAADEAPFRTLRRRHCATAGLPVRLRGNGRLRGQLTVFSRLNVEAARFARHGYYDAAERLASAAKKLEDSPVFQDLREQLADLPIEAVTALATGDLRMATNEDILRAAALATATVEQNIQFSHVELALGKLVDQFAGHVTHIRSDVVFVERSGVTVVVPRWLVDGVHRGSVGDPVVVRTERISIDQAVVEVIAAVEAKADVDRGYSPFGRLDARTTTITEADLDRMADIPAPLHIPIPVVIHE